MPSSVWKGHLTFGLVSIPIRLVRAARKERVKMHYVHRAASAASTSPVFQADEPEEEPAVEQVEQATPPPVTRVRQTLVSSEGEQPVSRSEVLRGYEVEPERYVVFDPGELKGLQRRTSPNMEIVRSVKLAEIDPVFLEASYYLLPDKGGEKPYAILFAALRQTGHVALAKVGMYGREHVMIVRPGNHGMLAHTMFYVDEIRFENEFRTDVGSVGAKELELAKTFLEALEAPFAPEEFKDAYREELQALIAKKTAEADVSAGRPAPAAAVAPPVDILEALKKSIAMARKPPASETAAEIKSKRQVRKAR